MYKISFLTVLFFLFIGANAQNVDIDLLRHINLNRDKLLDPIFIFITNSATPISIVIPIILFALGLFRKGKILQKKSMYIALSVITSSLISSCLKIVVNRVRPFITYSFIEKMAYVTSPSFPSGHTAVAFVIATSLSIAFPKWYVITFSFLWAISVGYSRMFLGVHYPSDVLAGAAIGSCSAYLVYKISKYVNMKHTQKTP
ncbi:phosphatase PAP2 family protein [Flavobacterium sp. ZT3R25]